MCSLPRRHGNDVNYLNSSLFSLSYGINIIFQTKKAPPDTNHNLILFSPPSRPCPQKVSAESFWYNIVANKYNRMTRGSSHLCPPQKNLRTQSPRVRSKQNCRRRQSIRVCTRRKTFLGQRRRMPTLRRFRRPVLPPLYPRIRPG